MVGTGKVTLQGLPKCLGHFRDFPREHFLTPQKMYKNSFFPMDGLPCLPNTCGGPMDGLPCLPNTCSGPMDGPFFLPNTWGGPKDGHPCLPNTCGGLNLT